LLYFLLRTQAFSVSQLLHLPLKSTSKRERFQTPQQNQQCNCKQNQQSIFGAKSFAIYNAGWPIELLFCVTEIGQCQKYQPFLFLELMLFSKLLLK